MLGKKINDLKEQEYGNLEKIWSDISGTVRQFSPEISMYTVFSMSYLAYLVDDNQIKDTKGLIMFADGRMDESRRRFIEDNIYDLWWLAVRLGNTYQKEVTIALVLWGSLELGAGMHRTPESISKLAVRLLEGSGGTLADFCCGDGSFLLEAVNREAGSSYFGVESDAAVREVAAIRMELASYKSVEIDHGSVFSMDKNKKFDRIFCEHPWGYRISNLQDDKNGIAALASMIPELMKPTAADWLFVANAAYHLSDGGRAVVVTLNKMAQNGSTNAVIRRKLVELGWLEAVISLPAKLYITTSVVTLLLVLSRNNREVRMVDAGLMALQGKKKNVISDESAAEIVSLLGKDAPNSVRVSLEMLEEHDYVYNPSEYLNAAAEGIPTVVFNTVVKSIKRGTQIKASDLHMFESNSPTDFRYLVLANIQDGIMGGDFIYLSEISENLEKYCVNDNDLIISRSGVPVRIAVASIKDGQKFLANGNLFIIELDRKRVNPYFVKAYFESTEGASALAKIMTGTTLPNIPVDSLLRMHIPLPPLEEQDVIADKCREKIDIIISLKERLAEELKELKNVYR